MSESYKTEGTVKVINDLQTFPSGFTKREFVVEVQDGNFPQMVKFELVKDKTALLDSVAVGESVEVQFNIRGNEYNGKYYVNLVAWQLKSTGQAATNGQAQQYTPTNTQSPPPQQYSPAPNPAEESASDSSIPF